jgi:hypothetical protein
MGKKTRDTYQTLVRRPKWKRPLVKRGYGWVMALEVAFENINKVGKK